MIKAYYDFVLRSVKKQYSRIAVIYTYLCIIYNILFIINPIRDFIENSVFIYFSKILCVVGIVLAAVDLCRERISLKVPNKKWIYLLLSAAVISTIYRYSYDFVGNIKSILWSMVQMTLIYSVAFRLSDKEENDLMIRLHSFGTVIFIPVIIYMFYQFINLEYYITEKDMHQGWYEGRLYGITHTLYYGTSLAAVLLFGSVFMFIYSKHKAFKLMYLTEILIYGLYIILSDTRTIFVGIAAGLFVLVMFGDFLHSITHGIKRIICKLVMYMLLIAVLLMLVKGVRTAMLKAACDNVHNKTNKVISAEELDRPKNQTLSSRRTIIWKSYADILGDDVLNMIFGFSPYGYDRYIWENYPDSYVVKDFKALYPYDYARKKVYGAHNTYLHVMITTGIFGFIAVIGFIFSSAHEFLKKHISARSSFKDLFFCSILVMLLSFIFFEVDIFLRTTAMSFVFWLVAGILLKRLKRIEISKTTGGIDE